MYTRLLRDLPLPERWAARLTRLSRHPDQRAPDDEEARFWAQRVYQDARAPQTLSRPVMMCAVGDVGPIGSAHATGWLSPMVSEALVVGDPVIAFGSLDAAVAPPSLASTRAGRRAGISARALESWARVAPPTVWSMHTPRASRLGHAGGLETAKTFERLGEGGDDTSSMWGVGALAFGGPIRVVEAGGARWGVLALDAQTRRSGALYAPLGRPGRAPHWSAIEEAIALLRRQRPHVIVASVCWGDPFALYPGMRARKHAEALLELGVDIVLGRGARITQDAEIASIDGWDAACPLQLRRGGPPRAGLIMYDLGTFASTLTTPKTTSAPLLRLTADLSDDPDAPGLAALGIAHVTATATRSCEADAHLVRRLPELRALAGERLVRRHLRPVYLPLGSLMYGRLS